MLQYTDRRRNAMLNHPGSLYAHEKLARLRADDRARRQLIEHLVRTTAQASGVRAKRAGRRFQFRLPLLPRLSPR
jgi:hypothetical protein